jgi:monofunctional biosynthetic peptidoglycan transglycosylase
MLTQAGFLYSSYLIMIFMKMPKMISGFMLLLLPIAFLAAAGQKHPVAPDRASFEYAQNTKNDMHPEKKGNQDDSDTRTLLQFGEAQNAEWQIVNDGVMGGLSRGQLRTLDEHHSAFEGVVSLANNGGFTSMVTRTSPLDLSDFKGMRIYARPCTPGFAASIEQDSYESPKTYAFRLKIATNRGMSRFSYETRFNVPAPGNGSAELQSYDIPFGATDFTPVFRGRQLTNVPDMNFKEMRIAEIGFMISDKQQGAFCLELGGIDLY